MAAPVTATELSRLIGRSRQAIANWEELGLPVESRDADGARYDPDKVLAWLNATGRGQARPELRPLPVVDGQEDPVPVTSAYLAARTLREQMLAARAQIDLAERAGRLVAAEGVEREIHAGTRRLRDYLLGELIDQLSPVLVGRDEQSIRRLLEERIRLALAELSGRFAKLAGEPNSDGTNAAVR